MADSKKWYASKTIWVAAVTVAVGVFASLTGQQISQAETLTILGFIFMILRLVTNGSIDLDGNDTNPPAL